MATVAGTVPCMPQQRHQQAMLMLSASAVSASDASIVFMPSQMLLYQVQGCSLKQLEASRGCSWGA